MSFFLLSSCLSSLHELTNEDFLRKLNAFKESLLGEALQKCCELSGTHSISQRALSPPESLKVYFKTSTCVDDAPKTQEAINGISLLLSVFLQVNCVGPLVSHLSNSEAALEERHIMNRTLDGGHRDNCETAHEKTSRFWTSYFLGHPNDRVGESHSQYMTGPTLLSLAFQLECDGETLPDSTRGLPYLWSAIQIALSASSVCSDRQEYLIRLCVAADVAFVWQQALDQREPQTSCTLQMLSLHRPLKLALLADELQDHHDMFAFAQSPVFQHQCFDDHPHIPDKISSCDAKLFFQALSSKEHLLFFIQIANRLTYFGRNDVSLYILNNKISVLARFNFTFSSCVGKRREHQQVLIPQLVLETHSVNYLSVNEQEDIKHHTGAHIESVELKDLDPTSDILSCVETSEGKSIHTTRLTTDEVLILLAFGYAIYHSAPKRDEILMEQLRAVVERSLNPSPPNNPLLQSCCLWLRCHAEFYRSKTHDRALHQLHALSSEFTQNESTLHQSLAFVLLVVYPFRTAAGLYLGSRLTEANYPMAARDLFIELWMWEDAAECLIAAGRKSLALELLKERYAIRPSPRLLCCLGDAENNASHYEAAWTLSGNRYARAKRSLGNYYLSKKELKKAAEHYKEALNINPLFDKTWFALGCCLMNLGELDEALTAFSRVVLLQPENGEAWANAAAIHCQKGKHWDEAFICIREAVKYCRNNWRMWDTYIKVAVRIDSAEHCILGATALLDIGQKGKVPTWIFSFLSHKAIQLIKQPSVRNKDGPQDPTIDREVSRICEFYDLVEKQYISDDVMLYMCHASVYAELNDGRHEFPLRLKEFRTAINTLPTSLSKPETQQSVEKLLLTVLEHIQMGYRRWCTTCEDAHEMQKTAGDLKKLLQNLLETLTDTFPANVPVLRELQDAVSFFSQQSS